MPEDFFLHPPFFRNGKMILVYGGLGGVGALGVIGENGDVGENGLVGDVGLDGDSGLFGDVGENGLFGDFGLFGYIVGDFGDVYRGLFGERIDFGDKTENDDITDLPDLIEVGDFVLNDMIDVFDDGIINDDKEDCGDMMDELFTELTYLELGFVLLIVNGKVCFCLGDGCADMGVNVFGTKPFVLL